MKYVISWLGEDHNLVVKVIVHLCKWKLQSTLYISTEKLSFYWFPNSKEYNSYQNLFQLHISNIFQTSVYFIHIKKNKKSFNWFPNSRKKQIILTKSCSNNIFKYIALHTTSNQITRRIFLRSIFFAWPLINFKLTPTNSSKKNTCYNRTQVKKSKLK